MLVPSAVSSEQVCEHLRFFDSRESPMTRDSVISASGISGTSGRHIPAVGKAASTIEPALTSAARLVSQRAH